MKCCSIIFIFCALIHPQEVDTLNTLSPAKAAKYGALFPGGGQFYNGKWLKGAMVISLEAAAIYQWQSNKDIYNNYEKGNYTLPKHRYLEKRNKYAWWIFFIYVYGILDAMVDAHLNPFNNVMSENIESSEMKEEE